MSSYLFITNEERKGVAQMNVLGHLKTGERVVERYNPHCHPLNGLLADALLRVESGGRPFILEVVDFGHHIGESICVPTGPSDEIVFAKRPNRFGFSRFVKNREPEPCSTLVVILKTADGEKGSYVLVTAFIGGKPEPEPWDRNATPASREFWTSHALVWGSEQVVVGTETTRCPW